MCKTSKIDQLFKSSLSLSNKGTRRDLRFLIGIYAVLFSLVSNSQIGNYVSNGSFEDYYTVLFQPVPYSWTGLTPGKYFGELLVYPNKVPVSSYGYQWAYHGKNHLGTTPYSQAVNNNRGYPKNPLKETLRAGSIYCVRLYVNLTDVSTYGIDALGAYFGDATLDTIQQGNKPVTYLNPQIENPINNIITDTMNWVPITGTFVANGTEKYMVIGNFKTDANTNSAVSNTTHLPPAWAEYFIDAVSVIEVDIPAYAGPDKAFVPGDSAYIGRDPDFAIDPGCVWFKLPEMTPIDTISGMWVKPTVTTTYVVRQRLDCSSEKWDTVVVHINPVGIATLEQLNAELKLYPIPAKDVVELSISNKMLLEDFKRISIYNSLGQFVREEEFAFTGETFDLKIEDLNPGAYSLELKNNSGEIIKKRFFVSR